MRTRTTRPSGSVASCSRGPAWRLIPPFWRTVGPSVPADRPDGPCTPSDLAATLPHMGRRGVFWLVAPALVAAVAAQSARAAPHSPAVAVTQLAQGVLADINAVRTANHL